MQSHIYSPVIFVLIGCGLMAAAVYGIRLGKVTNKQGNQVTPSENPLQFWAITAVLMLLGMFFFVNGIEVLRH